MKYQNNSPIWPLSLAILVLKVAKKLLFIATLTCIIALTPFLTTAETIDVLIKGIDDGVRTNKQQDYIEALMNAKLQAIERAGVAIESITKVENFELKYDLIESKAKALLLPGFQAMDMGYQTDGTYQVVLVGKVKTLEEGIETKDLRYAKNLVERRKKDEARKIIFEIINDSNDDNAVAEALYYSVVWRFATDDRETLEKLRAYYPNFKHLKRLDSVVKEREAERKRREAELRRREAERKREEEKRREAAKKKWELWQIRMGDDFNKAQSYDKSSALTPGEKKEVWSKFLSSYKADNPHYTKDERLRRKAEEKLLFWKEYKPMEFVYIKPGSFMMGNDSGRWSGEKPVHKVTLTKGFYMQTTEVTQGQWKKVMGSNPSSFKDCGNDCPVESVSWNAVQKFIKKLNQQEGTNKYRLPTEAEWEYACRAGTTSEFSYGYSSRDGRYYAWSKDNSRGKTHPVAQKSSNPWGLYDMHGNVAELCQDWYGNYPYPSASVTDPTGPSGGKARVSRGSSWNFNYSWARSAFRGNLKTGFQSSAIGFRCVRIE